MDDQSKTKGTILGVYLQPFDERVDREAARDLAVRLAEPLWELKGAATITIYEALAMLVGMFIRSTTEDDSCVPITVAIMAAEIGLIAARCSGPDGEDEKSRE